MLSETEMDDLHWKSELIGGVVPIRPEELRELLDEIARLRAELDKRPNLDANDCTALLCVISGDIVQPDLGWFGRIEDELSAVAKRG